ncbi:MAG: HD domain-containing protein [Candidatus Saganbacteria bacterium]|nr:HD domain-containing protein [Candidatus Saganbacteria bacterium]
MSFSVKAIKDIRIFPTARAIKRLQNAGHELVVGNKPLNVRGRLGAGSHLSEIIRHIGTPETISQLPLKNSTIILDGLSVENSLSQLTMGSNLRITAKWLVEGMKVPDGAKALNKVLEDAGISQREVQDILAEELKSKLSNLAKKTWRLSGSRFDYRRQMAAKIVKNAVSDFIELANLSERGDEKFVDFIMNILLRASLAHDQDTPVHLGVVTLYSAEIAVKLKEMGLDIDVKDIQRLKTAALLHDIGKMAIPNNLMTKGDLSKKETKIIQEHLPVTVYLLEDIKWLKNVVPIIQHHHDKKGCYPKWVCEGELKPSFQILAEILEVADVLDGMTSPRKYKKKERIFKKEAALNELRGKDKDRKFIYNQKAVDALEKVLLEGSKCIYNVKNNFSPHEIWLVFYGIEHLIKKSVLPHEEIEEEDLMDFDSYMMYLRPLLWFISGRSLEHKNAPDFINAVVNEVDDKIMREGLSGEFIKILKLKDSHLAPLYITLYRALKVDEKKASQTFSKLVKIYYSRLSDPDEILNIIDSFQLIGSRYTFDFFEWISKLLFEKDTSNVPVLGEGAFIDNVDKIHNYIFK